MSSVTDAPASTAMADAVIAALATVRDPELDQPVTTLGFVASCTVSAEGRAQVRLRLPTYFCAPNFAFLMVADAYDAVTAVPGVTGAEVVLEDHFASDAINQGVAAQAGFVRSFDGEAVNVAATLDEGDRFPRIDAGLLRLRAGVHLYVELRRAALFLHLRRQRRRDLLAVDRLDHVEQRHRFPCLVRLQRSDQVQFDIRPVRFQAGPFRMRLLDAVLSEHALAGLDHRTDRFDGKGLGDGNEDHRPGRPRGIFFRPGDLFLHGRQPGNNIAHLRLPSLPAPASAVDASRKAW